MTESDILVFVYGTLKRNCRANGLLKNSFYLGEYVTLPKYALYSCLTFPALVRSVSLSQKIRGEVYKITPATRKLLDQYEGIDYGLYSFDPIELEIHEDDSNFVGSQKIYAYFYQGNIENWEKIDNWTCYKETLV